MNITDHYFIIMCLLFKEHLSTLSATMMLLKLFPDHYQGLSTVHRAKADYESVTCGRRWADGLTYMSKRGDGFYINTGDRVKYLSEEFLSSCAPEWGLQLRSVMENWED